VPEPRSLHNFTRAFGPGDMNQKSAFLMAQARAYVERLSQHAVLSQHWAGLSAVVKGSTARGNADRYSDIDLVLFCDEPVRKKIVRGYYSAGLINRKDGLFILFAEQQFEGHYHVESYQQLAGYFRERDFMHAWDYSLAVALHDPGARFAATIRQGNAALFADPVELVKRAYLDLQLDLDWMRHPLKRGDSIAALLHAAALLRGICRIAYLLDCRPYPPDKWLIYYLSSTAFGRRNKARIAAYAAECASVQALTRHLSLEEYALYRDADALIQDAGRAIARAHGAQPWIERWYEFV
jgi:hypothetical protein